MLTKARLRLRLLMLLIFQGIIVATVVEGAELPDDFQLDAPPGPHVTIERPARSGVEVATGTPQIATTYFYWYDDATGAHLVDHDGTDALTEHPPTLVGLSYNNVDWHYRQLDDMIAAGIDVVLPVYWGGPRTAFSWSDQGLPKLIAAREKLLAEGKSPPAIGMFYDTSTLRANGPGYHVDLTTPAGKRWFYGTVRNFFSLVPVEHRVHIDGRPMVMLYSHTFAKEVDESLFPAVRAMFRKEFGTDLYLIKRQGWPGDADSVVEWGAALSPKLLDTAALGPGYNHSAVPGRTTLVRERDNGKFYRFAWECLLSKDPVSRPWLTHVETWNEFHEGTEICETREFGRQYIDLTRRYADMFHARRQIPTEQRMRGPTRVWATSSESRGMRIVDKSGEDGPVVITTVDGQTAWATKKNAAAAENRYLYFDVDYLFLFEGDEKVRITVHYFDEGPESFRVEYDSSDPHLEGLEQMFRDGPAQQMSGTAIWKTATFDLPRARFADRANGCDFRLHCRNEDLLIRRIEVTRIGGNH